MTTRADYVAAIAAGRDQLVESARAAGPETGVPSCKRWTVRDLLVHIGNVHDWAAAVLRSGVEQPQVFDAVPAGVGPGFDELLFWYAGRADALLDLLLGDQVPDDAPVWTFGPSSAVSRAAFWPRRQAHEVTMHSIDAMLAAGQAIGDAVLGLDPAMSADGVDEVLTVMLPRVAMYVPRPDLPGRLALVATDTGDLWVLDVDGQVVSAAASPGVSNSDVTNSDVTGSRATDPAVAATLIGSANGLFALLWRRAFLDVDGAELGVGVEGDRAVVDALFAARLTP